MRALWMAAYWVGDWVKLDVNQFRSPVGEPIRASGPPLHEIYTKKKKHAHAQTHIHAHLFPLFYGNAGSAPPHLDFWLTLSVP